MSPSTTAWTPDHSGVLSYGQPLIERHANIYSEKLVVQKVADLKFLKAPMLANIHTSLPRSFLALIDSKGIYPHSQCLL